MSELSLFSDIFTNKKGLLFELDARIKIIFTIACLTLVLLSTKITTSIAVFALSFLILVLNEIPLKIIVKRIFAPMTFAGIVLLLQSLNGGHLPLVSFSLLNMKLIIYKEGVLKGFLIAGKIIGATSTLMLLGITTPAHQLFLAGRAFKMPSKISEVGLMTYRYIFVLIDKAVTMKNAQTTRLGYSKLRLSLSSFSSMAGMLFIHSYDQSKNTYDAMKIRGYRGTTISPKMEKINLKDNALILLAMLLIALALTATVVI